ncbi:MAG TPA: solute carrier family 23 protein [bacterium]|nr:solute carrier family 23 protein [bacterium]HPQ66778.1 solute carrier family 23 protein [bacterium]
MSKTKDHIATVDAILPEEAIEHETRGWVVYPIGSRPKMGMAFLLGVQQYLTMFGSTVLIPFIIGKAMGMPQAELALLISTIFLVSGLATLLQQSPLGNRLPIIQGGTFSFLGPMFAIVGMCAAQQLGWRIMIQQVAAAVMFASIFEIALGYTGLMGFVKRVMSPIVIGPTIAMIGLGLFNIGAPWMAKNWIISGITLVALVLYSQVFSRHSKVFLLFPVLLAVLTGWAAAGIGTVLGLIPEGNEAYLFGKFRLLHEAPWFSLRPLVPFKWGFPALNSITVAGIFGMLAGFLASMIESVGDYYACARIAEGPVPTERMISRGIGTEGLGCLLAGILQTGNGTTSYSENIGAIGLTRVASRRVIKAGAVVMLVLPLFGKFGATLATLPQPVVGAMFVGLFGLIAAVGLSNLQFVNLNNSRNLFIIGISFFAGLSIPYQFNPMLSASAAPIAWGDPGGFLRILGNILQAVLSTGMAVTAIVAIILDNLLPGATREERGLTTWEENATEEAWEKAEAAWAEMEVGEECRVGMPCESPPA